MSPSLNCSLRSLTRWPPDPGTIAIGKAHEDRAGGSREEPTGYLIRRMAQTMHDQLVEIMPEFGQRCSLARHGQTPPTQRVSVAAQRRMTEEVFFDRGEWSVWDGDECLGGCVST